MANTLRSIAMIAIAAIVLAVGQVAAQNPLGDYSGEGALLLSNVGLLRTNLTKGSVTFSYASMGSAQPYYLGADATLDVANGLLSALKSGTAQIGGKGAISLGLYLTKSSTEDSKVSWLALRAGGGQHDVSLYDPSRPVGNRVYSAPFTDASLDLHYNDFRDGSLLWAISLGYARTDNSNTVDKVTVTTMTSSTVSTTGTSEAVTSKSDDAINVEVYRKQETWRLNGDIVDVIATSAYALHGFVHYGLSSGADELHVGLGLYALKGGNPLKDNAGGVVVELINAGGMSSAKLSDHIRISLVGSLKLP
ncbi:MAG: hypothetical protein JWQ98_362 [Chlorobi bacterium]|nr:hypothetical protein [Chlorobiota bacterium]